MKTSDGRQWSWMTIDDKKLKMLWDSGASVTVLSESYWKQLGCPRLNSSNVLLSGVFSVSGERPLGVYKATIARNRKIRKVEIIVVKRLQPNFIGGVNIIQQFGSQLVQVNNIESVDFQNEDYSS